MKHLPSALNELVTALKILPGVGQKSAQRMAIYLLEKNKPGAENLQLALNEALSQIDYCQSCYALADDQYCPICLDSTREKQKLCVVESPLDLIAVESAMVFKGQYFVLNGRISPLDGIGPDELKIEKLFEKIQKESINELILAVSPTVEGEATAHYITDCLSNDGNISVSRLAYGVPFGGELEYLDQQTLFHAFNSRMKF